MALIYDLVKDRRVYSIDADRTVLEAARFMMEHTSALCPYCATGNWSGSFLSAT